MQYYKKSYIEIILDIYNSFIHLYSPYLNFQAIDTTMVFVKDAHMMILTYRFPHAWTNAFIALEYCLSSSCIIVDFCFSFSDKKDVGMSLTSFSIRKWILTNKNALNLIWFVLTWFWINFKMNYKYIHVFYYIYTHLY